MSNLNGKTEKESAYPKVLNDVPGVIIKVQPTFGFITIKEPVKTTVYFTPSCFNWEKKNLLQDLGIVPGKKVRLNARIGNLDFEFKYCATKVWIPDNVENEVLHPEGFLPKVPKTRETGLYDAHTSEGCGSIQKVFDSYGFIIVDGDQKNMVFFHKSHVCNVENVHDLSKIFNPGDLVEYKAVRSKKRSRNVRWEATKVWIRKKIKTKAEENAESATSDYESISGRSRKSKSQKASDPKQTKNKHAFEPKEVFSENGKIYPCVKGFVIKFGEKDSKLADADSCLFYIHKVKVDDVSWEFNDGDAVKFDGVKIKSSPGYKALLSWVGEKPDVVPIALGDFPEQSDEDIEDVSENESYISNTSSTSVLTETNLGLSKTKRQNVYGSVSSLASNSSQKSHNRSRYRVGDLKRYSNYIEEYSHSVSSYSSQARSWQGSKGRHRRSKSRNSRLKKNYKSDIVNNSESQLTNCISKASSRESVYSSPSDMKNQLKPKTLTCIKVGGDTPYPADAEVSKFHLRAHGREGIGRKNNFYSSGNLSSSGNCSPCSDDMYKQVEETTNNLIVDDFDAKADLNESGKVTDQDSWATSTFSSRYAEIFLSDDNFNDSLEEVNESPIISNANDSNETEDTPEYKLKPCIKQYHNLDGLVKKVFARYAEIENDKLKNPGTFFWNEMYHNGVPVPDKFDDLKEVLTHGQTVKFNCFEIVDDLGTYFLKVTVAWKGSIPKITEITPKEFIAENNINFSGCEISVTVDLVQSECFETTKPPNAESMAAPRKFLTVASMRDDDDSDEKKDELCTSVISQVTPLKEDSDLKDSSNSNLDTQHYSDIRENIFSDCKNMDLPELTDAVSRVLESFKNSQIDSNVVASDLVNMILSTVKPGRSSQAN